MTGQIGSENHSLRGWYRLILATFAIGQLYLLWRYFATGTYSVPGAAFLFATLALALQWLRIKWVRK